MDILPLDHDLHIHSQLSLCSGHPLQTKENILQYAIDHKLKDICVTDHFWDQTVSMPPEWYAIQNIDHIEQILPLPHADGVRFHFGCETEFDVNGTLGISPETMHRFEFIIVPTTHMHMDFVLAVEHRNLNDRIRMYVKRLEQLLNMDLPRYKIGIAHLSCDLIAPEAWNGHMQVLDGVPETAFADIFRQAKAKAVGIELNMEAHKYSDADFDRAMRPYRIAKEVGCQFYFGSDAHDPERLSQAAADYQRIASWLQLTKEDIFRPSFVK